MGENDKATITVKESVDIKYCSNSKETCFIRGTCICQNFEVQAPQLSRSRRVSHDLYSNILQVEMPVTCVCQNRFYRVLTLP